MALHLSHFEPDPRPERTAEWLASLWQGPVPDDLVLHRWLYLDGEPRAMALLWEGGVEAAAWVTRAFGTYGRLETTPVIDATAGLAACLHRDLGAFAQWLRDSGSSPLEIDRALEVRRRGLHADSQEEAQAAGRQWAAEVL